MLNNSKPGFFRKFGRASALIFFSGATIWFAIKCVELLRLSAALDIKPPPVHSETIWLVAIATVGLASLTVYLGCQCLSGDEIEKRDRSN